MDGHVEGRAGHDRRLQGADARPAARRRHDVQRHRRRRMAERDRERRRRRRLHADAGGAAAARLRVGRRRRAGGRRELAAIRAEGLGQGALRIARASRRRLLVRHLLAGGRRAAPSEEPERARRSDDPEDDRDRTIAVGVPSRHLHQRGPSADASVRRLSRAQPRRERVRLHGRRARARRRERGAARRAHPHRHRRPGARSADRRRHGRAARAPDAPAAVRALSPLGDRRRRARGDTALGRRGAAAARHGTRPARIR